MRSFSKFIRCSSSRSYDKLIDRMGNNVFPMQRCEALSEILEMALSEAEADFLSRLPNGICFFDHVEKKFSSEMDSKECRNILKGLFEKGIIIQQDKDYFEFPNFFPGWLETFWMKKKSTKNENDKELANLMIRFLEEEYLPVFETIKTKPFRVLFYDRCLEYSDVDEEFIKSYEKAEDIIQNALNVGVCESWSENLQNASIGSPSSSIHDNRCFVFDQEHESIATYLSSYGFAELVSKEEALEILEYCKENGCIQVIDNSRNPIMMMNSLPGECALLERSENLICSSPFEVVNQKEGTLLQNETTKTIRNNKRNEEEFLCPTSRIILNEEESIYVENEDELCIGCGKCVLKNPYQFDLKFRMNDGSYPSHQERRNREIPLNRIDLKLRMARDLKRIHLGVLGEFENTAMNTLRPLLKALEEGQHGKKLFSDEGLEGMGERVVDFIDWWKNGKDSKRCGWKKRRDPKKKKSEQENKEITIESVLEKIRNKIGKRIKKREKETQITRGEMFDIDKGLEAVRDKLDEIIEKREKEKY